VFPYTFQLADPSLRAPQEILARHAAAHNVDVIDTTDDFARAVFDDPELVRYLRSKGKGGDEILAYHRFRADRYFFDENHFTGAGNRLVAERLYDYLQRKGLVGAAGARAAAIPG
jgi:lysophospholipase L1-like esterase